MLRTWFHTVSLLIDINSDKIKLNSVCIWICLKILIFLSVELASMEGHWVCTLFLWCSEHMALQHCCNSNHTHWFTSSHLLWNWWIVLAARLLAYATKLLDYPYKPVSLSMSPVAVLKVPFVIPAVRFECRNGLI